MQKVGTLEDMDFSAVREGFRKARESEYRPEYVG